MKQREKLIELLDIAFLDSDDNYGIPDREQVADHLLANGVVLLPCRCCECAFCEDGNVLWCRHLQIGVSKDAYCSGGKRKGGDE